MCSLVFSLRSDQLLAFLVRVDAVAFASFSVFDAFDDLFNLRIYSASLPVAHCLELFDGVALSSDESAGTLDSESTS